MLARGKVRPKIRRSFERLSVLLVLIGCSSVASATATSTERSKCLSEPARNLIASNVDYSSDDIDQKTMELLRDDVRKLDSIVLTKRLDTRIARKRPVEPATTIATDKAVANAAEILAEKRLLEARSNDASDKDVKTSLPGVDAAKAHAFRKQMYRTDI